MKQPLPANINRALSTKEAAKLLGIDASTLRRQVSSPAEYNNIPVPTKYRLSNNRMGYYLDEVQKTIEARKRWSKSLS